MKVTFEDANRRDWSDRHMDFLEATQLLLLTYRTRAESSQFRSKLEETKSQWFDQVGDLNSWASELREAFPLPGFGASREETQKAVRHLTATLVCNLPRIVLSLILSSRSAWAFIRDKRVNDWGQRLWSFSHSYSQEATRHHIVSAVSQTFIEKTDVVFANPDSESKRLPIDARRMNAFFDCLKDIIHLSWDSGLRSWWAPAFLFQQECCQTIRVPKEELSAPTRDGLLGPIFPGQISTSIKEESTDTSQTSNYQEWLLLSMSRNEMQAELGKNHARAAHQMLQKWGYYRGHKWEPGDFDMVFDRIFLKHSLERIAEARNVDPTTVQRRTHTLASLLELDLPRAPRKETPSIQT